jgi:hypothetical protein
MFWRCSFAVPGTELSTQQVWNVVQRIVGENVNTREGVPLRQHAWATIRNASLGKAGLTQRGYNAGIDGCILLSSASQGISTPKMIAATLEALVGAAYMDGGDAAAYGVIHNLGFLQHELLLVTFNFLPLHIHITQTQLKSFMRSRRSKIAWRIIKSVPDGLGRLKNNHSLRIAIADMGASRSHSENKKPHPPCYFGSLRAHK